jgi:hypothetical protein
MAGVHTVTSLEHRWDQPVVNRPITTPPEAGSNRTGSFQTVFVHRTRMLSKASRPASDRQKPSGSLPIAPEGAMSC